jgi:hypothetical protein
MALASALGLSSGASGRQIVCSPLFRDRKQESSAPLVLCLLGTGKRPRQTAKIKSAEHRLAGRKRGAAPSRDRPRVPLAANIFIIIMPTLAKAQQLQRNFVVSSADDLILYVAA